MAELVAAGVVVIVDEAPIRTDGAGDRARRAVRQSPQPSRPHVPRVELEGAGHVAGDEAARRRIRGDIDAADERHAKAFGPGRGEIRHGHLRHADCISRRKRAGAGTHRGRLVRR